MSPLVQRESKLEKTSKPSSDVLSNKSRTAKSPASYDGSSDSEDSDSSEADGGLVLVQKKHREGGGGDEGEGSEPDEDAAAASLLQKGKKKMRITSDGVAAVGVATKRVFDEDGAAVVSCALTCCYVSSRVEAPSTRRCLGRSCLCAFSRSLLLSDFSSLCFARFCTLGYRRSMNILASVGVGYRQARPLPFCFREREQGYRFEFHVGV